HLAKSRARNPTPQLAQSDSSGSSARWLPPSWWCLRELRLEIPRPVEPFVVRLQSYWHLRSGYLAYGRNNTHMRSTSAQMTIHVLLDLVVGRLGIGSEQIDCSDQHTGRAITALRRLLFHKRSLQRMQPIRHAKSLACRNIAAHHHGNRCDAG